MADAPATSRAVIDYGYGEAQFWGRFDAQTVEREFYCHANQCFGIRKSIARFELKELAPADLPEPWRRLEGAATVLQHGGDTIVWNAAGDKIKSEWD